jgi:hypothetical protein
LSKGDKVGCLGYHTMGTIRTVSRKRWSENGDRMDEIIKASRILVHRKKQRKSSNQCKTRSWKDIFVSHKNINISIFKRLY